jgi:hypothetical protein
MSPTNGDSSNHKDSQHGQQPRRKVTEQEAALTAKNYRLAKELVRAFFCLAYSLPSKYRIDRIKFRIGSNLVLTKLKKNPLASPVSC